MKHNPDDRSDNVERIQANINHTIRKMEAAEDMMDKSLEDRVRKELAEKNQRRREALEGMKTEIAGEAAFRAAQRGDPQNENNKQKNDLSNRNEKKNEARGDNGYGA